MQSRLDLTILQQIRDNDPDLLELNLEYKHITDTDVASLAEALKSNTNLVSLKLGHNYINDAGATSLAEALKINNSLKELTLWHNGIGNVGMTNLAEALKINTSLTILDLGETYIKAATKSLVEALKINTGLTSLILTDCGIQATEFIEVLKYNYTLTYIDISDPRKLREYFQRNYRITDCLSPIYDLMNKNIPLDALSIETLEETLSKLTEIVPELNSLPDDHYLSEIYRLLTAVGHMTQSGEEAQMNAFYSIIPSFKNKSFQLLADEALGKFLSFDLSELLKKNNTEQEGLLLTIYSLRNHLHIPDLNELAHIALFKLIYQGQEFPKGGNKFSIDSPVIIIGKQDFLNLIQKAVGTCKTGTNYNIHELSLLEALLDANKCCSFTANYACQSPVFIKTFKALYPNAKQFSFAENFAQYCILGSNKKDSSFLVTLPQIMDCKLVSMELVKQYSEQVDYNLEKENQFLDTTVVTEMVIGLKKHLESNLFPQVIIEDKVNLVNEPQEKDTITKPEVVPVITISQNENSFFETIKKGDKESLNEKNTDNSGECTLF
jgi:hypothetical protein